MLKLLHHPRSTYARRVRLALLEKNIPFEAVEIDMAARQHKSPEYLALNPYGRVPTIDDDGFILYESNAILMYLEATRPTPSLVPADAQGRALVDMHLRLCDLQLGRYAGTIIFPKRFLPEARWDKPAMAAAKAEIEKHLAILEPQLAGRDWLVGDRFTLADLSYIPFVDFLGLMEIDPPPAVAAWVRRLLARPHVAETRPDL
jgi:glutathione S-transferase